MTENNETGNSKNKDVNNGQNEKVSTAGNEKENGNNEDKIESIARGTGIFSWIRMQLSEAEIKKYRKFVVGVAAISSGVFAFLEGFGRWWFGFWPGAWVAITIAIALNVVWLMAVCGYMSESTEKKIKGFSLNTLLMIALPALVLGIAIGYITLHWRNTEKIVILVESFDGVGKDPYYVAKSLKSRLERSIRLLDRHRISVVLGKQYDRESSKDIPLDERALKYRADMVISGWYTEIKSEPPEGDSEILIAANFYAVRAPQSLPAIFRRHEESYPLTLIFSRKEIEDFTVHATLASRLGYECVLMIGAGAYAAGDWKTAEYYFSNALERIKQSKVEAFEKSKATAQKSLKSRQKMVYAEEHIEGDRALLTLYLGNCLSNQHQLDLAIAHFHEAVSLTKDISPTDTRYGYIMSHVLLNRGIAYREKNAFELAASDFEEAGKYARFADGVQRQRLDEPRFYSRQAMQTMAKKYYNRGKRYLKNKELGHARAELETAADMYRNLYEKESDPNRQTDYGIRLGQTLVNLGHLHNRIARPELMDDKHTEQAISCLNEAYHITEDLEDKGVSDPNNSVLRLRADCLRHLGEAHRAQDQVDEVEKAIDHHEEARDIWLKFSEPNKAAEEQTRVGNVYRRLNDLDNDPRQKWQEKAVGAYTCAVKMWMVRDVNENFLSESFQYEGYVTKATENITAHHLGSSLLTLADAYVNQPKPNDKDIANSCKLLEFASECYSEAHRKLDICKDREWVKKVKNEEMNFSMKDDLSWCLTLYGYALTRKAVNDRCKKTYSLANSKLEQARKYHEELGNDRNTNRVLNLFALSLTQYRLGGERNCRKAIETFYEACSVLRYLTREKKKVWYLDHVCAILREVQEDSEFRAYIEGVDEKTVEKTAAEKQDVDKEDVKKKDDFESLTKWLTSERVQDGRRALDRIIKGLRRELMRETGN